MYLQNDEIKSLWVNSMPMTLRFICATVECHFPIDSWVSLIKSWLLLCLSVTSQPHTVLTNSSGESVDAIVRILATDEETRIVGFNFRHHTH